MITAMCQTKKDEEVTRLRAEVTRLQMDKELLMEVLKGKGGRSVVFVVGENANGGGKICYNDKH
jgi:hypothetical protein